MINETTIDIELRDKLNAQYHQMKTQGCGAMPIGRVSQLPPSSTPLTVQVEVLKGRAINQERNIEELAKHLISRIEKLEQLVGI